MPDSLTIHLENTSDDEVYAYIIGYEIDNNHELVMVKAASSSVAAPRSSHFCSTPSLPGTVASAVWLSLSLQS